MKKITFAKIGTSLLETQMINQFDDVKVEVRESIFIEVEKLVDVEKEIDGEIVIVQEKRIEQEPHGENIYFTLPDGTIPDDIENWQSRPDPILQNGWVVMQEERPTDGYYIANKQGKWIKSIEVPESITKRQAMLQLSKVGLYESVTTLINSADNLALKIEFDCATTFARNSSFINSVCQHLNLDDANIDNLFIEASKL